MTATESLSAVISASAVSLLLILFIITTTFTLFLCRMKFKMKAAKDVEASNERKSSTKCEKVREKQKSWIKTKACVPVAPNQAYLYHNTSECLKVPVHRNDAHAVVRCENLGQEVMVPNKAYALHKIS